MLFVFKQKTAYDMRISDWSSDVCSSDLLDLAPQQFAYRQGARRVGPRLRRIHRPMELHLAGDIDFGDRGVGDEQPAGRRLSQRARAFVGIAEIGRASWRERVCQYV